MARPTAFWLMGLAGFVLALELVCRVLPVSTSTATDYYIDPLILSYPPHHRWTTSTGWDLRNAQTLEANNFGFVSARNFERNDQAVALIGDSFVEASMLDAADRPGAQLESALASRPVYSMGSPGSALLDYAERIRFAHERFAVQDFVVLMERGDVRQSLCGSGNIHGPCLDPKSLAPQTEIKPPAGTAKRILRHSALAQYLFSQLKFSPYKFLSQAFAPSHPVAPSMKKLPGAETPVTKTAESGLAFPVVDAVTSAFFARIKPHVVAGGHLVIVIDSDRGALYSGQATSDPSRARFIELARAAGALVIDTEPLFREQLVRSPLKFDVGPYDGHLNSLGIRLVSNAAARELKRP